MIVKEPDAKFAPAPAGVHAAVCVDEIDMGLVKNHFNPEDTAGSYRSHCLADRRGYERR